MVFHKDLEANQFVFPNSGYHQRVDARTRFRLFFDDGAWDTLPLRSGAGRSAPLPRRAPLHRAAEGGEGEDRA